MDDLAPLLDDRSQLPRRSLRQRLAGLLLELPTADGEQVLAWVHFALGDRPVALVLAREERPARVGQEHLEPSIPAPEEEDAGADPGRHLTDRLGDPDRLVARQRGFDPQRHPVADPEQDGTLQAEGLKNVLAVLIDEDDLVRPATDPEGRLPEDGHGLDRCPTVE